MALALAIVGDLVSPRERGRYQGWFGAVFALAAGEVGRLAVQQLGELQQLGRLVDLSSGRDQVGSPRRPSPRRASRSRMPSPDRAVLGRNPIAGLAAISST
jgi:hypothetical protein